MPHTQTLRYEIRIRGHLDETYARWLEGLSLHHEVVSGKPFTVLSGVLSDQAALFGVLNKLNAMGLSLIDLRQQEL